MILLRQLFAHPWGHNVHSTWRPRPFPWAAPSIIPGRSRSWMLAPLYSIFPGMHVKVVNSYAQASEWVLVSLFSSVDLPTEGNPISATRASPDFMTSNPSPYFVVQGHVSQERCWEWSVLMLAFHCAKVSVSRLAVLAVFTLTAALPGSKSWTRYLASLAFNRPKWYSVASCMQLQRQMSVNWTSLRLVLEKVEDVWLESQCPVNHYPCSFGSSRFPSRYRRSFPEYPIDGPTWWGMSRGVHANFVGVNVPLYLTSRRLPWWCECEGEGCVIWTSWSCFYFDQRSTRSLSAQSIFFLNQKKSISQKN